MLVFGSVLLRCDIGVALSGETQTKNPAVLPG
jgi:hypothetical protein